MSREPLKSTVTLVDYDPRWPELFEAERKKIAAALGARVLRLEHVGSTSVPNLCAKPVIDIVLVVENSADEPAYLPPLEAAKYLLRIREPQWFEHRLLKNRKGTVNLHVFSGGCTETDRMVLFRDWLRTHLSDRRLYEQTKKELAKQKWDSAEDYADAKSQVVRTILARALARK